MTDEIEYWRAKIDAVEDNLISLLNERAKFALEIGKIKKKLGLPIKDAKREEEILNRVAKKNQGPASDDFIRNIFKSIIDEAIKIEKEQ